MKAEIDIEADRCPSNGLSMMGYVALTVGVGMAGLLKYIIQEIENDQPPYNGLPMVLLGLLAFSAGFAGWWLICGGLTIVSLLFMMGFVDGDISQRAWLYSTQSRNEYDWGHGMLILMKIIVRLMQAFLLFSASIIFILCVSRWLESIAA